MLIISDANFMNTMQPFIDWKVKKGIETTLVDVSTIGDADDIKAFVEEYYYNHGINFLLLVGDIDHIPSPRFSEGAGSNSPSDTYYGFIPAEDYYPDVFVGRFSAETEEHVHTMVNRTILYERYPDKGITHNPEFQNRNIDFRQQDIFDEKIWSSFNGKEFEYAKCSTCTDKLGLDTYTNTKGFFSEYSKSTASEDMAEVFSHLMIGINLNNLDPILEKKINFIKTNLLKIDQNFIL